MTGYGIPWSVDELHVLRAMWAEGASGVVIGTKLGRSRCAVLGKARRLGLDNRVIAAHRKRHKGRPSKPDAKAPAKPVHPRPVTRWGNPTSYTPTPPQAIVEPPAPEECKRLTIMQLRPGTCRWPLGDPREPSFAYCGLKCDPSLPYCAGHTRLGTVEGSATNPRTPARAATPAAHPEPDAIPDVVEMMR